MGSNTGDDEPARTGISSSADDWRTAVTSIGHDNRNRELLRELYLATFAGKVDAFPGAMAGNFEAHVPPSLPWGGVHRGPDAFVNTVLPQLAVAVDVGSMRLDSISADGDRVAALLSARTAQCESPETIRRMAKVI